MTPAVHAELQVKVHDCSELPASATELLESASTKL